MLALVNLADAYKAKGDKDKAIEVNLRIWRLDPTNQSIAQSIVHGARAVGRAGQGAPDSRHAAQGESGGSGDDPQKWLLQLRAGQFKNALATGEELIKVDTAAANLDFYNRQIGAAQSDSNAAKVQEWASQGRRRNSRTTRASRRCSRRATASRASCSRRSQAARRATQIDPKNGNAWLFAVVTANDLNMPDSAVALAQQAIAAGADKTALGQALLAVVNPARQEGDGLEGRARLGSGAQGRADRRRGGSDAKRRSSTSVSRRSRSGSMRCRTRRSSAK